MGYAPDVVPPAPEDDRLPAAVVLPVRAAALPRAAGLRVLLERVDEVLRVDEAGLRAVDPRDEDAVDLRAPVVREDAGFDAVELRDEDAVDLRAPVARDEDAVDADLRAAAPRDEDAVDLRAPVARDDAGFDADDAVLRAVDPRDEDAADLRAPVARDDAGFDALDADVRAVERPPSGPTSSAWTRFARPSTSLRRPLSSSRTRSSSTSRMRLAAAVTSLARPRVDLAPSAEALNVRSTAARTASTASAAPAAAFLPFFFESFFAMAARS
jgi:hypothetical protein